MLPCSGSESVVGGLSVHTEIEGVRRGAFGRKSGFKSQSCPSLLCDFGQIIVTQ